MLGACHDAKFFDPSNPQGSRAREEIAYRTLSNLIQWLESDQGDVGIFDATNTTRSRRQCVLECAADYRNIQVVFVENICDDPAILAENYRVKCE